MQGGKVIFHDGEEIEEITSSVGSRQGCSLGSFLYCLAQQEELTNLGEAYPEAKVMAYCDDVYITEKPAMAVDAYNRWAHAQATRLQGSLRNEKGLIYTNGKETTCLEGIQIPSGMKVSKHGFKILGAPIGDEEYTRNFIKNKIDVIERNPT